jgi:hypothetical protein
MFHEYKQGISFLPMEVHPVANAVKKQLFKQQNNVAKRL